MSVRWPFGRRFLVGKTPPKHARSRKRARDRPCRPRAPKRVGVRDSGLGLGAGRRAKQQVPKGVARVARVAHLQYGVQSVALTADVFQLIKDGVV